MDTIIHTEASHGWGGQEMRILTECRWFREQGFNCVLFAKEASPIAKKFEKDGFEVIPITFTKSSQVGDFVRCIREFKRLKPAMVGTHSNIDTRVALAAAASAGVSRRIRYRHVSIPVRPSSWNKIIYRHLATRIVTTANSITHDLVRDFSLDTEDALSIPTGVRGALNDSHHHREEIRNRLGIPQSSRLISQISVLRNWKGHTYLMDAFEDLAATRPNLHLVLVGGGNMLDHLQTKSKSMASGSRIHFVGHVDDPYPYFQAADVVTLASTGGEGVPQSILQAFACSCPVVATTVGGIPDIVRDRENGLLVSPGEPKALATALEQLLGDPAFASRLGAEAHRTFSQQGSIDHMGNTLRTFLNL